jgi:hypothetical protein
LLKDQGVSADNIKHKIIPSDIAYFGEPWAVLKRKQPGITRRPTADFTPEHWLDKGACFRFHEVYGLEDPLLVAMADQVPERRYPKGDDAKLLTKAVAFALKGGNNTERLSNLEAFAATHGLTDEVTPMKLDADVAALKRNRIDKSARNRALRKKNNGAKTE